MLPLGHHQIFSSHCNRLHFKSTYSYYKEFANPFSTRIDNLNVDGGDDKTRRTAKNNQPKFMTRTATQEQRNKIARDDDEDKVWHTADEEKGDS